MRILRVPRYLTFRSGLPYFQRNVPKRHMGNPVFPPHKVLKRIYADIHDDRAILDGLLKHNQVFEETVRYLDNNPEATEVDIDRLVQAELEKYDLRVGDLNPSNPQRQQILDQLMHETDFFEPLMHHDGAERDASQPLEMDKATQLRSWAYDALEGSRELRTHKFSDAWTVYEDFLREIKNKNPREIQNAHGHWRRFIEISSDLKLSKANIELALRQFMNQRFDEGLAHDSVKRGMTTIAAAFRTFIEDRGLEVEFNKPKIPRTKKPNMEKERVPLEQEEQIALLEMVRSEKPWKELYVLLAFHSGCSPKELVQTEKESFRFDADPPRVTIHGTKTQTRTRTVPLVFQVERIAELVDQGIFDQLVSMKPDNISNQISRMMKKVKADAVGHSLRHTLRYNGAMVMANSELVTVLGGWGDSGMGMTRDMANYGRGGYASDEFLAVLKEQLLKMLQHLEGSRHA